MKQNYSRKYWRIEKILTFCNNVQSSIKRWQEIWYSKFRRILKIMINLPHETNFFNLFSKYSNSGRNERSRIVARFLSRSTCNNFQRRQFFFLLYVRFFCLGDFVASNAGGTNNPRGWKTRTTSWNSRETIGREQRAASRWIWRKLAAVLIGRAVISVRGREKKILNKPFV